MPDPGTPEYLQMVEDRLKAEAAAAGVTYDPTDMEGFIRNAVNGQGSGTGPNGESWAGAGDALANQIAIYGRRGASTNDRVVDSQSQEGNALYGSGSGNRTNTPTGYQPSGNGGGQNWFSSNSPTLSNYGAPPDPFTDTFVAGEWKPPDWTEIFKPPTTQDMMADPGYQTRLDATQRGFERSAASKGTLLSGGFIGRTLPRALGEQASNEYANTFQRAYDTYQQRYGQFSDSANRGAQAFNMNETGRYNQFQSRFAAYDANAKNQLTSERDRWQREMDLARLGLDSTTAGRPD